MATADLKVYLDQPLARIEKIKNGSQVCVVFILLFHDIIPKEAERCFLCLNVFSLSGYLLPAHEFSNSLKD